MYFRNSERVLGLKENYVNGLITRCQIKIYYCDINFKLKTTAEFLQKSFQYIVCKFIFCKFISWKLNSSKFISWKFIYYKITA